MKVLLKKRDLWFPWTVHGTHWKSHQPHKRASKKKKRRCRCWQAQSKRVLTIKQTWQNGSEFSNSTRPEKTWPKPDFFYLKQKWVNPWPDSCFLWVNRTWPEPEPFLKKKKILGKKKIVKLTQYWFNCLLWTLRKQLIHLHNCIQINWK